MTYDGFDIERVRKEAQREAQILFFIVLVVCLIIVMTGIPVLSSIALIVLILAVPIGIWYSSKKGTEAVEDLMRKGGCR